jgi:hypothetical protein
VVLTEVQDDEVLKHLIEADEMLQQSNSNDDTEVEHIDLVDDDDDDDEEVQLEMVVEMMMHTQDDEADTLFLLLEMYY